jgi:hypothetical protein
MVSAVSLSSALFRGPGPRGGLAGACDRPLVLENFLASDEDNAVALAVDRAERLSRAAGVALPVSR